MGLLSVVAIGMGGIIGAGILPLLGAAVSIAGASVSVSSFSWCRRPRRRLFVRCLAVAYPSRGGAAHLNQTCLPIQVLG